MKEHKPLLLHVESVPSQDDLSWPRIQPVRSSPDVATVHVGTAYTVTHSLTVARHTTNWSSKTHTRIKLHQYMANASHSCSTIYKLKLHQTKVCKWQLLSMHVMHRSSDELVLQVYRTYIHTYMKFITRS